MILREVEIIKIVLLTILSSILQRAIDKSSERQNKVKIKLCFFS